MKRAWQSAGQHVSTESAGTRAINRAEIKPEPCWSRLVRSHRVAGAKYLQYVNIAPSPIRPKGQKPISRRRAVAVTAGAAATATLFVAPRPPHTRGHDVLNLLNLLNLLLPPGARGRRSAVLRPAAAPRRVVVVGRRVHGREFRQDEHGDELGEQRRPVRVPRFR